MLAINIPGAPPLRLSHLVLGYNGTLAGDGAILPGGGRAPENPCQ
jgi:hypothetical protein